MEETSLGADIATAMSGSTSTAEPSTSDATPETSAAATGTGTTVPAQTSEAIPSTDATTKQGPIPFDVHAKALDNARLKATAEWERDYGWAKQVNRAEVDQAVQLAQRYQKDRLGFLQEIVSEAQNDPTLGPQLRSMAARALSAGRGGNGQPQAMPEPDVSITDEQGNVVGQAFSAKATTALVQHAVREALTAHKQELAPVIETHKTLAAQQQKALDDAEGEKFAGDLFAELKSYPHFETHMDAIGKELVRIVSQYPKDDPRVNAPEFLEAATLRAYNKVVLPTLNTSARASVLADLTTKSHANTVSPGAQSASAPQSYADMSWADAFQSELAARR